MQEQEKPAIVLPADVYDTIEFATLPGVFSDEGGIGAGTYREAVEIVDGDYRFVPVCAIGYGAEVVARTAPGAVVSVLRLAGIDECASDSAVYRANERLRGVARSDRVPFAEWVKELNIVRGA